MKWQLALVFILLMANFASAAEVNKGLNLEDVSTTPENLAAGSDFVLLGKIRNIADRDLNAIRVTVQGGFPFSKASPLSSFFIERLHKNEVYPFKLDLSIDEDAEAKEYTLAIVTDYYTYDSALSKSYNVIFTQELHAKIKVDKGVDFGISNVAFPKKILPDAKDAIIVVDLQNTGIKAAKELKLTLATQYPFVPTGKTYFIDELKAGETRDAVFHVDVDSAASSQIYPIDLFIEWKEGDVGYSKTKTFGISVEKATVANFSSYIVMLEGNYMIFIGVAIVALFAIVIFGRRKKVPKVIIS